ncbi:MAG: uroporphyrinogen decarboxylase family protein [Clostridia bacterium]|nr:uroporphyrinogen decarboxylase family protein [Clostridia bacterium]
MKRNMSQWLSSLPTAIAKKPLPLLSFPCVSLLGVTVRELISQSELQAKGMLAVAKRTDSAAAVSFMDLSLEAECFGATINLSDHEVPTVKGRLIDSTEKATALEVPAARSGRTGIYIDAISKASRLISDRPVIAGIIGPFSLAARLLDVSEIMIDCYDDPDMVHTVLEKAAVFLSDLARAYKAAGADGIVMAEPVAGLLSPDLEREFSAPYVKRIVDGVRDDSFAVIYHNCGNNTPMILESLLSNGCDAYHFGNAADMERILAAAPSDKLILGNIDPAGTFRMGTPDKVRSETLALLEKCSKYPGFVLSSGCDVPPMTPWENIDAFFAAAREFYGE